MISSFNDLLRSAREQAQPQRLLFVFTTAGLPDDATPEQRERFQAGQGGTLTPLMCVDKAPDELDSFDTLREESRQFGQTWDLVFTAAISGSAGLGPTSAQAEAPLQRMVESIKSGGIADFIAFDGAGQPVQIG
ncbi:MAG: ribonucleotide reductase subunit alpha [Variovorax sp.]